MIRRGMRHALPKTSQIGSKQACRVVRPARPSAPISSDLEGLRTACSRIRVEPSQGVHIPFFRMAKEHLAGLRLALRRSLHWYALSCVKIDLRQSPIDARFLIQSEWLFIMGFQYYKTTSPSREMKEGIAWLLCAYLTNRFLCCQAASASNDT
jgi:hypothetical protein